MSAAPSDLGTLPLRNWGQGCRCGQPASPLTGLCPACWNAKVAARTPEEAQAIGRAIVRGWGRPVGPSLDDRMAAVDRMVADDKAARYA